MTNTTNTVNNTNTAHALTQQAYQVCLAIEKCGASLALSDASGKASDLLRALRAYFASVADQVEALEKDRRDALRFRALTDHATRVEVKVDDGAVKAWCEKGTVNMPETVTMIADSLTPELRALRDAEESMSSQAQEEG